MSGSENVLFFRSVYRAVVYTLRISIVVLRLNILHDAALFVCLCYLFSLVLHFDSQEPGHGRL